jgi:hypothetical protein
MKNDEAYVREEYTKEKESDSDEKEKIPLEDN